MTDHVDRERRLADFWVHLIHHAEPYHGYAILQVGGHAPSITCLACGKTSFSQTDVVEKYCGACHVFHEGSTH